MSRNPTPLVSVLMTAYNREKYLAEAIESVLASTFTNFELIIVDDVSRDQTVAIAQKYAATDLRIKVYFNETNLGDYPNRNRAASYANGKYLKYLDSDDMIFPDSLEVFVSGMEQYPTAAIGLSSVGLPLGSPFPVFFSVEESYRHHFFKEGLFDCGPSGVIIRKDVFVNCGGFSGKRMIGDIELWLKIAAEYPVIIVPPSLVFWRIHEGQEYKIGIQTNIYLEKFMPVIEEALCSPYCNLTASEKERVNNYYRKIAARGILKLAIQKKDLKNSIQIAKNMKLKLGDMIKSIFFMKQKI